MRGRTADFGRVGPVSRVRLSVLIIGLAAFFTCLSAQTISWRSTTKADRWVDKGTIVATTWADATNYIELFPDSLCQTIEGFGGCFSEKAWDPLMKLDPITRDSVIRALFDTSGCSFNYCRLPIGSSDFAMDMSYYSLDDSVGDYAMKYFNLRRDSLRIIPFAKAALAYQPGLVVWGSPWSPPQWMKTDGKYYGNSSLKQDTQTLNAYSLYLEKAVRAFRAVGINMTVLAAQNEPTQGNNGQGYPSGVWTPAQYANFYRNYLIPRFRNDQVGCKLMWGTFCAGIYSDWITTPLSDTALLNGIDVFGLQNTEIKWAPLVSSAYPGKTIFQTETACCSHGGTNDWTDGVLQFDLLANFLNAGAVQYSEWNMVLDKSGLSGWDWMQTAMITVDTAARKVIYNPSFYGVKHWTHYIRRNARRMRLVNNDAPCNIATSAFRNPDGSIVLMAGNKDSTSSYVLTVKLGDRAFSATLPVWSLNTFVITPPASAFETRMRASALDPIGGVRLRNATLSFTVNPRAHIDAIDLALRDLAGRTVWSARRTGAELAPGARQAIGMKTGAVIPPGCYLLDAAIRSGGSTVRMATKVSKLY